MPTITVHPVSAQINSDVVTVTLNVPSQHAYPGYVWREDRRPMAQGDYRARAYRLSNGNPSESFYVVTCELILSDASGFITADVLDVAYPQDRTDLSDEMRYATQWASDMAATPVTEAPQIVVTVTPVGVNGVLRSDIVLSPVTCAEMPLDAYHAATTTLSGEGYDAHQWDDRAIVSEVTSDGGMVTITGTMVGGDCGSTWTRSYRSDAYVLVAVISHTS